MIKKDNIPFSYVFGGICSPLAGGRYSIPVRDGEYFEYRVSLLNFYNIGVRLTLQATNVSDYELLDGYTNFALSFLNYRNQFFHSNNGVIIASQKLKEYIQNNYPFLQIIYSIIGVVNDTNFVTDDVKYYNDISKEYDYIVLNTSRAFDLNFLKQIKDKNKFEIIVNTKCIKNCPFAKLHYDSVSNINKGIELSKNKKKCNNLMKKCREIYRSDIQSHNSLSIDDINNLSLIGFNNFKLEGRNFSKEEYLLDIKKYL